jgi:adenylylsulfate kinase
MTLNNKREITLWLTGLLSSGKTALALLINKRLKDHGFPNIEILDGDIVRINLSKGLGFSKEDRITNMRRVGFICHLLTRNGIPNIVALIFPNAEIRDELKLKIGNFIEVYLKCSLEVCENQDVKGLYKKRAQVLSKISRESTRLTNLP